MTQNASQKNHNEPSARRDFWLTFPQYLLPQHTLSRLMHRLCRCRTRWLKNALIRFVIKQYQVDMTQAAVADIEQFEHFNAFFTRSLKADARPLSSAALVSPVDGRISQLGPIAGEGRLVQAKGQSYTVSELLGDDAELAQHFTGGQFATIYLSPRDYHRIHMPCDGTLQTMRYIPGKLFSVNPLTVRGIPRVFARNERLVTLFETEFGPVAVILVGAIFVGSMQAVWHDGEITPPYGRTMLDWRYAGRAINFHKGEEMGRFNMGSTVIVLLPESAPTFLTTLSADDAVQLGQALVA